MYLVNYMATNIEMNILKDNNVYEVLYPKTDYNLLLNKPNLVTSYNQLTDKPVIPTVPSLPLSVANGGTGVTSYSSLASQLNSYINAGAKIRMGFYQGNGNNVSTNYKTIYLSTGTKVVIFFGAYTRGTMADGVKGIGDIYYPPIIFDVSYTRTNRDIIYSPATICIWDGSSLSNQYGPAMIEIRFTNIINTSLTIYNDTIEGYLPANNGSTITSWQKYNDRRIFNVNTYFYYYYIEVIF